MDSKLERALLRPYSTKSDAIASRQVGITLAAYLLLWWLYLSTIQVTAWLVIPFSLLGGLLVLRLFVLMHDCGHGSLFRSSRGNRVCGFFLGVVTGMPQYVWSRNHAYHHATNGDWERYRGPLAIVSTEEYEALDHRGKRNYWLLRHPIFLLPGGLFYVLVNPRYTWIVGTLGLAGRIAASLFQPSVSTRRVLRECRGKYWKSPREYLHMTLNNVVLLSACVVMCVFFGPIVFLSFYCLSLAVSGGLGILLFAVQHNFEHAYAQDTAHNDYDRAAIEGTSYLVLPAVLNWFTADIGYHHVHHLSAAIPNYHLARCHRDLAERFTGVRRVGLWDIRRSLEYLLWDSDRGILVSLREHLANEQARQRPDCWNEPLAALRPQLGVRKA